MRKALMKFTDALAGAFWGLLIGLSGAAAALAGETNAVLVGVISGDETAPMLKTPVVTGDRVAKILARFNTSLEDAIFRPDPVARGRQAAKSSVTVYRVTLENTDSAPALIEELEATPGVAFAEPDYQFTLCGAPPDDPEFARQWYLHNTGQYHLASADIAVLDAWDINTGSGRPVIAVIDTGIDTTHPDLVNQLWTNPQEAPGDANGDGRPGIAGFDDDGDGLIDEDSYGRQPGELGYTNNLKADDDENGYVDDFGGWNWVDDNANVRDIQGHGTHIAGIIGAQTNNAMGVAGVCPQARLMPLRVFQANGTAAASDIVQAIDYAHKNGASVINMSFTGPESSALRLALESAGMNSVLVASAGNDGPGAPPAYPAAFHCVIGVGASDVEFDKGAGLYKETIAPFTTVASADICAPGVSILSTFPGGGYTSWSGTSMAAPIVSGIAGLLISEKTGGFWGPALYQGQIRKASSKRISHEYLDRSGGEVITRIATRSRISALEALTVEPIPALIIAGVEARDPEGDGDGWAGAGETVEIYVTLRNEYGNAEGVTAQLTCEDSLATLINDSADYGNIAPGSIKVNDATPFRATISPAAAESGAIRFSLVATASNGEGPVAVESFDLRLHPDGISLPSLLTNNLTLPGAEYIVPGDLVVPAGLTLNIKPGASLLMASGSRIVIRGTLIAIGKKDQPILFTSNGAERWGGIHFDHATGTTWDSQGNYVGGSILADCIVERTRVAGPPLRAALTADSTTIRIQSCLFRENDGNNGQSGSIYSSYGALQIHNTLFVDNIGNAGAVYYTGNSVSITQSFFGNNIGDRGIIYCPAKSLSIAQCAFMNNVGKEGIVQYSGNSLSISQCLFSNNQTGDTGGSLSGCIQASLDSSAQASIDGNLFKDNQVSGQDHCASIITVAGYGGTGLPGPIRFLGNSFLQNSANTYPMVRCGSGSSGVFDFKGNYWGEEVTAEMEAKGANANISRIYDIWDDAYSARVNYADWLTTPPVYPDLLPYIETCNIESLLGIGRHEVALTFNRDMNTTWTPTVTFGLAYPYTQNLVMNGRWEGARTWRGEILVDVFTGEGIHHLRVADARDLLGNSSFPDARHQFEIDTIGLEGLTLQALPGAGHVALTIAPVNVPDLAGFNVYRALSDQGIYTKLNSAVIADTSYKDFSAPPDVTRWYKVAAVRTDFKESEKSDPASAAAGDGTPPVITHEPVSGPVYLPAPSVTLWATVTDNKDVTSVVLYWKPSSESEFRTRAMIHPMGNLWMTNLEGGELSEPGVDYYIVAMDAMGNASASGSVASPHVILMILDQFQGWIFK